MVQTTKASETKIQECSDPRVSNFPVDDDAPGSASSAHGLYEECNPNIHGDQIVRLVPLEIRRATCMVVWLKRVE